MPENTLSNIPLTASYTIPAALPAGEDAPAAFKAEAGAPIRASRSQAPIYKSSASIVLPPLRRDPPNKAAALLRYAPARPRGLNLAGVAAFMRPSSPMDSEAGSPVAYLARRNHSIGSQASGYSATTSGYHGSETGSGLGSAASSRDDLHFGSHEDLRQAGMPPAAPNRLTSEARITITDDFARPIVSEHRLARYEVSEATAAFTDGSLGLPAAARFRVSTPAIRHAVDALIRDCADAQDSGTVRSGAVAPDDAATGDVPDASGLYKLGRAVHGAMLDKDDDWPAAASQAIADAAARLAQVADPSDIDLAFVQLAIAFHTDNTAIAQLPALGSAGQLRSGDDAARQQLDAALDAIPALRAAPHLRQIARRIVDVVAEIAHDAYPRRMMGALLTASERYDIGAMHGAIQHLYAMHRASAQPDESSVDRHVSFIRQLPPAVQQQFMDTFMPLDKDAAQDTPTRGIHAYLESSRAKTLPGGYISDGLLYDQRRLITDLFAAAAILRGDESNVMPYPYTAGATTAPAQPTPRDQSPASSEDRRFGSGAIGDRIRRALRPTQLDRAQKAIARTLKVKARSTAEAQDASQAYAEAAQAHVRALRTADLLALQRMAQIPAFLKIDEAEARRLHAIDAAVTREFAVRNNFIPAVEEVIVALRDGAGPRTLADALDLLTYEMQCADSLGEARTLCELAVQRLALPPQDLRAALAHIQDRGAQEECERGMRLIFRGHAQTGNEALRLMPALRGLAAILQKAAPPRIDTEAQAIRPAPEIVPARAPEALRDMPPVQKPLPGTIAEGIWRRARTISGRTWWPASASKSARLARAHRQVAVSLKQQAASSRPLTPSQWKLLETAIKDIARLQQSSARYADMVEAAVRTLSPAECVSLNHVVDSYDWLLDHDGPWPVEVRAEQLQHLRTLAAVLGREPAIRHATRAVAKVIETVGNDRRRAAGLPAAMEDLAACLDKHASNADSARLLCTKALERLNPPARQARSVLAVLRQPRAAEGHHDGSSDARLTYRDAPNRTVETARAAPALHALSGALEARAAR
ncbi:Novel E3 ligase domain-containing protein [Bordetella sputigena]|uniref:hypothetical protein n=1 Tax=Bordetella sputigena TaxID=1416810 RepID=UPI0039EFE371